MPKSSASTSGTITFRLSAKDREWLDVTAKANGCEVAQLLRWALEAFRQYVDIHEGRLHLPIDIQTLWKLAQTIPARPVRYDGLVSDDALWRETPVDIDKETSG